jgi:ribosomal protein S18 acetylase RimI-like enzyme
MMKECLQTLKEQGIKEVGLVTMQSNTPAIKCYQKSGFEIEELLNAGVKMRAIL